MAMTRRSAIPHGNVFNAPRTSEDDFWNLHDVFLNASLQRSCMLKAPVEMGSNPGGFSRSNRGRFERTYVAFLHVLVEAWLSSQMRQTRDLIATLAPLNNVAATLKHARRSRKLNSMKDVRDYMFHRDEREYWDAGRVATIGQASTREAIYESFSDMFLAAMAALREGKKGGGGNEDA